MTMIRDGRVGVKLRLRVLCLAFEGAPVTLARLRTRRRLPSADLLKLGTL